MTTTTISNYAVKETATLNWTIKDFVTVPPASLVESDPFSAPNSKQKFQFVLKNVRLLDLTLKYIGPEAELCCQYRVFFVTQSGNKLFTQGHLWNFIKTKSATLFNYVTNKGEFHQYLFNGDLQIFCENSLVPATKSLDIDIQTDILRDYQTLFESCDLSDVVLVMVKDEKVEFKVHKTILAARSSVFKAMFSVDLEENKQNRVEISDIDADVFEHLLRFIYTSKITELSEFALELFVAADKYQLEQLKSICIQSLCSSIATESVENVLMLADMHNAPELKLKCIEYITNNSKVDKATDAWKQIKSRPDLLMEVFDSISNKIDSLN